MLSSKIRLTACGKCMFVIHFQNNITIKVFPQNKQLWCYFEQKILEISAVLCFQNSLFLETREIKCSKLSLLKDKCYYSQSHLAYCSRTAFLGVLITQHCIPAITSLVATWWPFYSGERQTPFKRKKKKKKKSRKKLVKHVAPPNSTALSYTGPPPLCC